MLGRPVVLGVLVALSLALAAPAAEASSRHVVMAWWQTSYDPAHPGLIWQPLYRPRHWDDGDDISVSHAHWTQWTLRSATATVRVDVAGRTGTGRVHLFHPGYCAAIHRRAFLRMRTSGGPWGRGFTENEASQCAGR